MYAAFTEGCEEICLMELNTLLSVIIVEDEAFILNYMRKKLSSFEEFQVNGAYETPEEALAALDEIAPDVAFIDIEMPRINGIELARRLLERKEDLRVIFTTAYSEYAVDAFGVEAVDYLMKPITNEDIMRVIKRLKKGMLENAPQRAKQNIPFSAPVRCFGCFNVYDKDGQILKWPTKKEEEAFAYFLVRKDGYVSKWELLEVFGTAGEDRGLQNLYNTIYRMKQVLKKLSPSLTIKKVSDGYMLESTEVLSDLEQMFLVMNREENDFTSSIEEAVELFFSYQTPLFGFRDYAWSFIEQKNAAEVYGKLCTRLLGYYRDRDQFNQAEKAINHYISQHVEDVKMMMDWIELLKNWIGHKNKVKKYQRYFNDKLKEADLPYLT